MRYNMIQQINSGTWPHSDMHMDLMGCLRVGCDLPKFILYMCCRATISFVKANPLTH